MAYVERLRKLYTGIELDAEDPLFLESFQIDYLPGRIPLREFTVMLQANPVIKDTSIPQARPSAAFWMVFHEKLAPRPCAKR